MISVEEFQLMVIMHCPFESFTKSDEAKPNTYLDLTPLHVLFFNLYHMNIYKNRTELELFSK